MKLIVCHHCNLIKIKFLDNAIYDKIMFDTILESPFDIVFISSISCESCSQRRNEHLYRSVNEKT